MSDKRFEIMIVVNGQPFEVKVGLDEQIGEAVEDALKVSGNSRTARRAVGAAGRIRSNHRYRQEDR